MSLDWVESPLQAILRFCSISNPRDSTLLEGPSRLSVFTATGFCASHRRCYELKRDIFGNSPCKWFSGWVKGGGG